MNEKTNVKFYGALLLLECLLWGIGNPIMKIGLEVVPPLYCLALRFLLAFLIFMLFFVKQIIQKFRKEHIIPYIIISAFTSAAFITCAFALMKTTATITGFLMSTAVIFTPILSFFILKVKLDKKYISPIIIVTIGLYLLCSGDGIFIFGLGEVLALLCGLSGAFMIVFSSKYLKTMDPLVTSTMQSGLTGLFCLLFAFIFEDFPGFTGIPFLGWGVIIYLAVGCTCLAYIFQNIALRHVPATYVALAFCTEPVFTAIASYFILGELLSAKGFFGSALIMISIIMASLIPEKIQEDKEANNTHALENE